jgi:uncharacterized protein YegL
MPISCDAEGLPVEEIQGQLVLPFYVLVDVSYSMTLRPKGGDGATPIDSANGIVSAVKDALDENPILKDKVRFSLVDFSDDAHVQIPLCDLTTVDNSQIPLLVARGGTSYASAFRTIQQQLDGDVQQLKADGHKVHRPVIFFLTDGEPTDPDGEWQAAFSSLTDRSFRARPNVIPFGVGEAKKNVLDQLVYPADRMRSFLTVSGVDAAAAVTSMAEVLIGSIIASASSVAHEGESGGFVLEDPDESGVWI